MENKKNLPSVKRPLRHANPRRSGAKITIRNVALPENKGFDEKLAWICSSLGFFETIDKGKTAAIIFKEIYLAGMVGQVLTSTTIAERIGMSRGSVINHLNNLKKAGLVEKGGKYYFARHKTMEGIITEVEDDMLHIFSRMKRVAKEIDNETDDVIRMK
ncbi:MAG: ArsR family transcriptional regulator [Candidatus Diapherotrites archaeon]|jgi:hypothetical protein|nr:ArsR family transcriptional regulator [Candidatus Diapherotrites archaeon]